jgi:nucleotide-binding universal stress UspA family protein
VSAFAAIDFSPSSIQAATFAARLMPATGSVTLVHTSIFAKPATEPGSIIDLYSTGARDRLAAIANDIARTTQRRVKTLIADGPVADVMTSTAATGRGSLIALGSHERELIDRLLIGSVRAQVIRHATCPVLVMPQPQSQPSDTSQ